MRFFGLLATAASLLASYVNAQNQPLAITAPLGGSFTAGSKVTITWTPTSASSVTLQLRYGSNSGNLATGAPIASNVPNTGSFTWTIPSDIVSTSYSIQITDSNGVTNYSPPFTVSGGTGSTSSAAVSSSSSAPSSTTSKSSSTSSSSSSSTSKSSSTSSSTTSSASAQTSTKAPSSGGSRVGSGGSLAAIFGLGALVAMA